MKVDSQKIWNLQRGPQFSCYYDLLSLIGGEEESRNVRDFLYLFFLSIFIVSFEKGR